MPSLGHRGAFVTPYSRAEFVSLSQNSSSGPPCGASPGSSSSSPRKGCSTATVPSMAASVGGAAPTSQDQVFRYQTVGSTCSSSGSGPALVTSIVINTSVGSALAYDTSTIQ